MMNFIMYSSLSIISLIKARKMEWGSHVAHVGEMNAYKILVRKPEGNISLGRPMHR